VQEAAGGEAEVTFSPEDWDLLVGTTSEHAAIRIRRFAFPEGGNEWDANALDCVVDVRGGAFHGAFDATLWTRDFVHFREGIERLDRDLRGEAALETIEGQIGIRLLCDRSGHVRIAVEAMDIFGTGNRLTLSFEFDQTMFGPVLAQLESILRRFPMRRGTSEA
jgi:hypothetical protein